MNPDYMLKALKLAKTSDKDIPIAALIVKNGKIIAKGVNKRERKQNTVNHAEIIAIQRANKKLNSWHLNDCEMYVTLEPCPMCASAILQARISKLYFGAYDLLTGSFCSKCDMRKIMGYDMYVKGGIMEKECVTILKNYFEGIR